MSVFPFLSYLDIHLPPDQSELDLLARQAWAGLLFIWLPLLAWLLHYDPRARRPSKGRVGRCKHGCIFQLVPKTRHCRRCEKCVAGFDHHCLWLNTAWRPSETPRLAHCEHSAWHELRVASAALGFPVRLSCAVSCSGSVALWHVPLGGLVGGRLNKGLM
ncbi:PAT18 [Symbiodinium sp. CCMP2592]|nr:PAT18 [Symbiodinium sp. CCMP2592]